MAMSPAELRRRRLNMLMAMSYAAYSGGRQFGAGSRAGDLLGVAESSGMAIDFVAPTAEMLVRDSAGTLNYYGAPFAANGGKIAFTRNTIATRINSLGALETVSANIARIDYDPVTRQPKGLLIEEQRQNILLNSDVLSTQSVTVTAVPHTLSFYGTGTVTLSGVSTAGPLVGTGAFPTRVTLTFTPTAGSLTLTVSGSVTQAQLEIGSFASSYIPTTGSPVTRNADFAQIATTSFQYNQPEGSVIVSFTPGSVANNTRVFNLSNGAGARVLDTYSNGTNYATYDGTTAFGPAGSATVGVLTRIGTAYKTLSYAMAVNGGTPQAAADATVNTATGLYLGSWHDGTFSLNGHIRQVTYIGRRVSNAELQTRTA